MPESTETILTGDIGLMSMPNGDKNIRVTTSTERSYIIPFTQEAAESIGKAMMAPSVMVASQMPNNGENI